MISSKERAISIRALFFLVFLSLLPLPVLSLEFNGTVRDTGGNFLNNTLINITIRNIQFTVIAHNATRTNASGWFNITLSDANGLFFLPVIQHTNTTTNATAFIGQSLPSFPGKILETVSGTTFFLKPAGTLNITAVNSTGQRINFRYQIKDQKLGYPIAENLGGAATVREILVYVTSERNYSIMIYPDASMPVSFNWNNFTAITSYTFSNAISSYNVTTKTLNKQFNTTLSLVRVSGYINYTNLIGWSEFTVVPYLVEPGNIVHATYGDMPYNLSAFDTLPNMTDVHNLTRGFYNLSLPATVETSQILLFATAKNGSIDFGGYRNVSLSYDSPPTNGEVTNLNFTHLTGLLGTLTNISMDTFTGPQINVSTVKQTFNLRNATNGTISNIGAHIEATLDYSSRNAIKFTWMEDIQQGSTAAFSLLLPNTTNIDEINIYTSGGDGNDYAPFSVSRTISQIQANNNFSLKSFSPGDIDKQVAASQISINLYHSNTTCDVPTPPDGCIIGGSKTADPTSANGFNPMQAILGGGKLSFRMGAGNILVHYVNVDLLASGPPDALFDDTATEKKTGNTFDAALRFGSQGPTIFDYVLVSFPYSTAAGSGLDESKAVNLSIPVLYDENWNVIWNTTLNGTSGSALAGNHTHYATHAGAWETLMNSTICVTNSSSQWFNITNPCFIDTPNNAIWLRLPHFSGTGPSISGTPRPAATATTTSTTSASGGSKTPSAATYSTAFAELTPYQESTLTYNAQQVGVETITFSVTQPLTQTRLTLTEHSQSPPGTTALITPAYKYFEVTTTNLPPHLIASSKITFLVPQEWLTQHQASHEQITLYKHTTSWTKLPTTYLGQIGTSHRYQADTSGFSFFAIGLESTARPSQPAVETLQEPPSSSVPLSRTIGTNKMLLLLVGLILFIILFFVFKHRTRSKH